MRRLVAATVIVAASLGVGGRAFAVQADHPEHPPHPARPVPSPPAEPGIPPGASNVNAGGAKANS